MLKLSLRVVLAETNCNLKDCLAKALRDHFQKPNVPISVELGKRL